MLLQVNIDVWKSDFENEWFRGQLFFGEMNLRIITKGYAVDSEIGFSTKVILQPFGLTSSFRQRES